MASLRFTDPAINSDKYWQASVRSDCTVAVAWGRVGTKGSSKTHQFTNMAEALNRFEKLMQEKVKKGYVVQHYIPSVEVGAITATASGIATPKVFSTIGEPELIDSRLRHVNWGRSRKQI